MKKYLYIPLSIIAMMLCAACSDDEPAQDENQEETKQYSFISYEEAIAQGLPCVGPEGYSEEIYPSRTVELLLPKDGSEVELELLSMANTKAVEFAPCENGERTPYPAKHTDGYFLVCSTEDCFVFSPYSFTTPNTLVATQDEPTKIRFKVDPSYKFRDGVFYIDVNRFYSYGALDWRYTPDLKVILRFEK